MITTNTPDTTRLSESALQRIECMAMEAYPGVPLSSARALIASHRTLAADLARVEAENERLGLAIRDIAFGNLSHNEIERIASDAWHTARGEE